MARLLLLLLFIPLFHSCSGHPLHRVSTKDASVTYMGRVKQEDSAAIIYWSGTSVSLHFTGTQVTVDLKDEKGDNYYYCIVDDSVTSKINIDTVRHTYTIATGLKKGILHKAELFKLTEESMGKTWLYGFETDGNAVPLLSKKRRKIEFYGNSITAGYSVDDTAGDSRKPVYFNNYYTYAAITARHFDAAYYNISKSGIGLMLSWFPIIMPEMYDRLDPTDSVNKWHFDKYIPDVVVIDLMQNDSWLVNKPDRAQFKARFGTTAPDEPHIIEAYKRFVTTIRNTYPDAIIICTLGSMDATKEGSPWPGYIEKAAASLKDKNVYSHIFAYKNTPGHPKRKEQQIMAESLIHFIDTHVKW